MLAFLKKNRALVMAAVMVAVAFFPLAARAAGSDWFTNIFIEGVQMVVEVIVGMLGKLVVQLIHILIMVAGYNGYMDSKAITIGWTIVRDVANLFFVAVIIIISVGSIVKPDKFGGAQGIFKVLLYAVFVNFSRTIAAFFIDISQLVMLTFVNGFAAAAGGNFVEALGVVKLVNVQPGTTPLTPQSTLGGLFLALLMMVIITVIVAVMVVALVTRMVMLWMLVVVSPLAFAMAPYERTHEYYATWWKKLESQLTTGPIIAFFLWLSLASFQGSTGSDLVGQKLQGNTPGENISIDCGDTEACSQENMIRFVIATVMLLAGLSFAQEFGGLGGSIAGSALSAGKKYANGALNRVGKASWGSAKAIGGVGMRATGIPLAANRINNRVQTALGKGLAKVPGLRNVGIDMQAGIVKDRTERLKKAEERGKYLDANTKASITFSKNGKTGEITESKTVPMEVAAANYNSLMKDKKWMAKATSEEKQFVMERATHYSKLLQNKEGKDLVSETEMANPNLIPPGKMASDGIGTRFDEVMRNMTVGGALKLEPGALSDATVVAHLDASMLKKVLDDGSPAQHEALSKNLRKFADRSDTSISAKDHDAFYAKITDNKRGVDTLSIEELKVPEVIARVMDKAPGKDRDDLFRNKEKKQEIGNTAMAQLNKDRAVAGFAYGADHKRLAEAAAVSRESIDDAYQYDRGAGKFKNTADRTAFEEGLKGKSKAEIVFAVDKDEIDATTEVGQSMADELSLSDLVSMAKSAEGNTKREDVLKKVIATMKDVESATTDAALKARLYDKIDKISKNQATNKLV